MATQQDHLEDYLSLWNILKDLWIQFSPNMFNVWNNIPYLF